MKFLFALMAIFALVFAITAENPACSQPKVVGPCRAQKPNFYFNSESKKCENFFYGGCQGNDNRFATEAECEAACL